MKILSIQVGLPRKVEWEGKEVLTSIFKNPVDGPRSVSTLNIEGDRQADLQVHGGADKAIYAYSYDTYEWWKKELGVPELAFGALGENLTLDELDEKTVFVGDRFAVGTCEIEAVQPRFPCFKLAIRHGDPGVIRTFNAYGRSGVYFRVTKTGIIEKGDVLKKVRSESVRLSIDELFRFYLDYRSMTPERAEEILSGVPLIDYWKKKITRVKENR